MIKFQSPLRRGTSSKRIGGRRRCRAAGLGFNPLFVGALRPRIWGWQNCGNCRSVSIPSSSGHFVQARGFTFGGPTSRGFNPLFVGALRPRVPTTDWIMKVFRNPFQSPLRRGTSSKRSRN